MKWYIITFSLFIAIIVWALSIDFKKSSVKLNKEVLEQRRLKNLEFEDMFIKQREARYL